MSTDDFGSRTARLATLVRRVRRSFVATVLAAGLLLAVAVALGWVVGGIVIDLALPLSVAGRQVAWCGWWAAVAAACGTFLLAPALRWPRADGMALRIERVIGDVHNQLLTVVDLARRRGATEPLHAPDGRTLRPDMVERLLDQTQARLRGFRSSRVLPWPALLRNAAIAAAAAGCIALLSAGFGDRFMITLRRLLDPTADIPPATWLQLRSPGDLDVLEGEPLEIRGRVERGDVDGVSLVIFDAAGRPARQPMRAVENGDFVARLDGLDHDARYRLEAGNTWTRTHAITILQRPEIVSLACRVRLPDYMRIDAPLAVALDSSRIEAPEGATVEFEIAASAEATSGVLRLCERSIERDSVERFDDRVWFEDDLPRDAVSDAPWKWTTTHAAGGLRSFTFGADGRPLAMRTRLEPLVLPREQPESRAFSLMARLDAKDPPTRLSVVLEHGQAKTELLWGDAAGTTPPAGAGRTVAGPLPQPGDWARLTVAMKSLGHLAGQPLTGATFSIDRGRALLDRPGWMERSEEVATRAVDRVVGEIPLTASAPHDPAAPLVARPSGAGTWAADVPVTEPLWVTAEVRSDHGHPNLPMQPTEIAPTVDRPPSIVVDAMPETLVLKVADDVPLSGRGFDDWGIDEICVLAGPDPARLAVRETLPGASPADRPPRTQVSIATSLSPETLGIAAGKSALWKLRIRDTKGQTAESRLFRVTVLTPPESDLAKTQVPALAQARREATQLARETARKPDEADAKREAVRDALAAEEAPAKRVVDEMIARLDRERRLADIVAKSVEKAAEQAASSDLVPRAQQEMLTELAREARSLERTLAGSPQQQRPAEQATADRDAAQATVPENDRTGEPESGKQPPAAKQSDATKAQRVAEAPRQSDIMESAAGLADALEAIEKRLNAQGAALQIDALAKDLARRADQLVESGRSDPEAGATRQQVRDIEQILGRRIPAPQAAMQPSQPAAAAKPAAPAEDTAGKPAQAETAQPSPPATPDAAAKAGGPPAGVSPPVDPIEAAADAASGTATSAAALAARLAGAAPKPTQPASPPAEAQAETQAREPGDLLAGDEVRQALAMAERARRLQARAAAQAEAAARAAAASRRTRDGQKPADGGDGSRSNASGDDDGSSTTGESSEGGAMSGRAEIDPGEALRGLDARQRAALYKLPPHIRDPLLEGMRQRGPAAYQGVIDTYFRQLGKDIPQ